VVGPEVSSREPNMVIRGCTCAGPATDMTHYDNVSNVLESHVRDPSMHADLYHL